MRIINVVGARPNLMKIAPLMAAYRAHRTLEPMLVHTGQHHDRQMSGLFFEELGIPRPDVDLGVHGGSHASQHARVMTAFEAVCEAHRPDLVLVVGDVNSTLSCALVASKLGVRVAHVEAGLRSFDRTMPEEINRVLTDRLSDLLFVSEQSGLVNLAREGLDHEGVHFVGNVMIDALRAHREKAAASTVLADHGLEVRRYAVVTLHRPANVDDPMVLDGLLDAVERVAGELPVVFPAHPRTRARLEAFGFDDRLADLDTVMILPPLGYLDFLRLVADARIILTDSGGIQEETTALRVPCVTLRASTERPSTCLVGTNRLAGVEPERIWAAYRAAMDSDPAACGMPAKWDGHAAERIAAILAADPARGRTPSLGWTAHGALPRLSRA